MSRPANAQATVVLPPPTEQTTTEWYGWQTILSDTATSLTTAALFANTGSNAIPVSALNGTLGYGLGPPLIHLFHRRPLIALADLALRIAALAIGTALGGALSKCVPDGDWSCVGPSAVGAGIGMLTAAVVDGAALSWETKGAPPKAVGAASAFSVQPQLVVTKELSGVGVRGTF